MFQVLSGLLRFFLKGLVGVAVLILLQDLVVLLLTRREEATWCDRANRDGANLPKFGHALVSIILLDHFGVVLRMLNLYVLIQTALGSITLGAVLNGTLIVSGDLGGRPSMPLFLFIIDLEGHAEHFLVFAFI